MEHCKLVGVKVTGRVPRGPRELRSACLEATQPASRFCPKLAHRVADWFRLAVIVTLVVTALICFGGPALAQTQMDSVLQDALDYQRQGDNKRAIDLYTQVIQNNRNSPEAYNWRGMAYEDMGDTKKALADYRKAVDLSPNYSDALNNLGELYRKQGDYDKAEKNLKEALKYEKNFAEAHFNMGLTLAAKGDSKEAIKHFNMYLRLMPGADDKNKVVAAIEKLQKAPPPAAQPKKEAKKPSEKKMQKPRFKPGGFKPGMQAQKPQFAQQQPTIDLPLIGPVSPDSLAKQSSGPMFAIINVVSYLIFAVPLFFIAKKTNVSMPWLAFVPIVNLYTLVKCAGKPWWWVILLILIPLVNIILWFMIWFSVARLRDKSALWGFLAAFPCTSPIGMFYLAFSK